MAAVDRVLPWRRHQNATAEELTPLLTAYRRRHPKASVAMINRAYETAKQAHQHQQRSSGESYINHPLAVALIVADLGLDEVSLAAALLHDAVEDTEITIADVEKGFGPEVAQIVDGVTKLERLQFDSKEAQQAATMRKMLVAMARDLRVLIIKLADRLHNMRTIAAMPSEKQQRIAHETLEIYAPLAHRLGMQELKQQLEDLSFASLYPKRFAELDHLVATRSPEREQYLAKAIAEVQGRLQELNINAEVTGRGKHLWSIYEKMVQKGREFDDIFDLIAVRVIVDSVKDCYAALGCIHGRYKPVVGRFKDYIAMPKFNLYQSLHTTVIGPGGKAVEMQIRTREMHQRAEWGVAAHWAYKDEGAASDIDWLNRIIDWQAEISDPAAFMENLKTDLEQDEVFVFTPKGKVVTLPVGSTTVDFAYAVHTEVGHACIGAKVNGRLVPLNHHMKSGDTCEIFTSKVESAGPSRDWLQFVESPRARNKIKQWFSRERREDMVENGRDELIKEFRREGLPIQRMWTSDAILAEIEAASYADLDSLLAGVGEGHVSARSIAQKVARTFRTGDDAEQPAATVLPRSRGPRRPRNIAGVHVEGLDDVLVRLSRCCTPVPGDDIVGFVTRGRGVSVHRTDCANAESLMSEQAARLVDVEWDGDQSRAVFRAAVEVVALDRSKLLRDVANSLSEQHVNIVACSTHTGSDRVAKMRFEFEMADPSHLESVLRTIKQIDAVYDAYRLVPGKG
ncbi:MAG: RelA/SpoT family protein [Ilumatobacteraceae bacterium]|jgi:GTP pyrophosphokinase|nr:bifunctional (p)ppGpp synthetase/guanosine-3',5'-bis(diphosphate) 3'-pyrophosphohydrolase [Acidimicrobiaceae bacterium]MBP6488898.1 bifunctional (p)ppGpp synthetase/guanosine-3',5'-bis(diphosphate) 3'-pyrophosphohydrolase [Ilumatobacteraceae bacterium]MBP7889664.1 bifunctional (p)ppGpp synthetase/guanosine-3',5'-bis(diphosphate) 3'-pyrophosphohydrolase [Ilumatobacteraceae bacterium]HAN35393.1 GTP pyrophosphokinase [Acidimicrobiaceae bacterium]HQY14714.1 bifunctional (p)ppGpp synthetase/guano